jgi:hypothetical protein
MRKEDTPEVDDFPRRTDQRKLTAPRRAPTLPSPRGGGNQAGLVQICFSPTARNPRLS